MGPFGENSLGFTTARKRHFSLKLNVQREKVLIFREKVISSLRNSLLEQSTFWNKISYLII